jgi:hypothetical protein
MKQTTPRDQQTKLHVVLKTQTLTVPEETLDSVVETMMHIDAINDRVVSCEALRRPDLVRMIHSLTCVLAKAESQLYAAHNKREKWIGAPDYDGRKLAYIQSKEVDKELIQSIIHSIRKLQSETPKYSSQTRHQVYIKRLLVSSLVEHLRCGFNVDVKI